MGNFEMLKALYDFNSSHEKTISFNKGEYFVLYQTSSKEKNWWPVVNVKGNIGFVPSNYVMKLKVEPKFLLTFLDASVHSLEMCENDRLNGIIERKELIQNLIEKRRLIEQSLEVRAQHKEFIEYNTTGDDENAIQISQKILELSILNDKNAVELNSNEENSKIKATSMQLGSCKKNSSTKYDFISNTIQKMGQNFQTDKHLITEQSFVVSGASSVQNKNVDFGVTSQDVYQIIDAVRTNTNLSFESSCEALRVVLLSLKNILPEFITPYLEAVALHLLKKPDIPKEILRKTHDAKRLRYLFSQIEDCKNDSEQRTWILHEDEQDIIQFLEELLDILAEDMKNKLPDLDNFLELPKMLIVIFSLGQKMPANHQEHLDENFVTFLFELLEKKSDSFVDVIVALLLAFNLQFNDDTQNIVLKAVRNITSAKRFTEKMLLLFNRQDDPTKILKHAVVNTNSVLKMLGDVFSFSDTAGIFYTNDTKVLIDILIRQLSDLLLDDQTRKHYMDLCRKVLNNTNYAEHTHRKEDLLKMLSKTIGGEYKCSADD